MTSPSFVLIEPDRVTSVPTITTVITARMTPYSAIVCPSSRENAVTRRA
jgi:hypothetical protein